MSEIEDLAPNNDEYADATGEFIVETASNPIKYVTLASPSIVYASAIGAKAIGKRIPVIGAAVTAGYSLQETFDHAIEGHFCKAGGALFSGTFETVGNLLFSLGGGDAAHYSAREAWITVAGDDCAPNETDIVAAYKYVKSEITGDPEKPTVVENPNPTIEIVMAPSDTPPLGGV